MTTSLEKLYESEEERVSDRLDNYSINPNSVSCKVLTCEDGRFKLETRIFKNKFFPERLESVGGRKK